MKLPYPHQEKALQALFDYFEHNTGNPLVVSPVGCHAPGTQVILFDGKFKNVESVRVGDMLLGPDGKPRKVLKLFSGRENMYEVTPTKGSPFLVNEGHILSLKQTNEGKKYSKCMKGVIENIAVRDFICKKEWYKGLRKLWKPEKIQFLPQQYSIEPYMLGILLGDGSLLHQVGVTTMDKEIVEEVYKFANKHHVKIRVVNKPNNKAKTYLFYYEFASKSVKNPLTEKLRDINLYGVKCENKYIPHIYKIGSAEQRLEILAGLIDSDGSLSKCGYDYISKSRTLSEDIIFICRSLGLSAYLKECHKSDQHGTWGTYYRVSISGNTSIVPCRIARKIAPVRKQKKNNLVSGFKLTLKGPGEFYGFELDGDHLYLTSDFFVHHNSGKSLLIAEFIRRSCTQWPSTNFLVLTHVIELVSQNAEHLAEQWPECRMSFFANKLNAKDLTGQAIFATINSIFRHAYEIPHGIDLIIIDEAHLIPPKSETMYRKFIADMQTINPNVRIIGFTGTNFRATGGKLTESESRIFTDVAYQIPMLYLIENGFLCPLITPKDTLRNKISTAGVGMRGGDFIESQLQKAIDKDYITNACVAEIVERGTDRKKWLIFTAGREHAEHVRDAVRRHGISCEMILGNTPSAQRSKIVEAYKNGQIKCLVNVGCMTTGFNEPSIDLLVFMRPTRSRVLYVQMGGRGMRTSPATGKIDCLVLDFGGVIDALGPIDLVDARAEAGKGTGDAPVKVCPECNSVCFAGERKCHACGYEFPGSPNKMKENASSAAVLSNQLEADWHPVVGVAYKAHQKPGGKPTLQVTYNTLSGQFKEWLCFEHAGVPREKACRWFRLMSGNNNAPRTVEEALEYKYREPVQIQVRKSGKYFVVTDYEFNG